MTQRPPQQPPPEEILDAERFMEYEAVARDSALIPAVLRRLDREGLRICDVGGASGLFLDEILRRAPRPVEAFLMEVDPAYRACLVNPRIRFLEQSILDNRIEDGAFDVVTFRHILHHLVGRSLRETLANQARAFDELLRIVRPGGWLLFEEEVNNVGLFSRIVYYLSRFANRHRLRWKALDTGKVVVSFLTRAQIEALLASRSTRHGLVVARREYIPWPMPLRWKLTLLMSNVGMVSYALQVHKPS